MNTSDISPYHGIFTPLITPIDQTESPDIDSLRHLIRFQLENGVHGLWVMGTSAEFASFDEEERAAVVRAAIEEVGDRVPCIVNVSDASTRLAIRHAQRAVSAGARAIAATPPYYNPHTQDEVLAHYRVIRDTVDAPLYVYNIPQTVRVKVELPTAKTLALEGTASGIKDSQNDLEYVRQLALFVRERDLAFAVFAGTRFLIDAAIQCGAVGAIPSIANGFPDLCVAVYEAAVAGDFGAAAHLTARIIEIESATQQVSAGSRNAAVLGLQKAILHERGIIANSAVTSPLRLLTDQERGHLLEHVGRLAQGVAV